VIEEGVNRGAKHSERIHVEMKKKQALKKFHVEISLL